MTIDMTKEKFLELYNAITQEDIDKNYKGLDYISWANAYKMLLEEDINATYDILENENGFIFEQFGICFVKTTVTAFGQTKKMWLPIMDNNHRAVKLEQMTGNQVNTSIMRCLTKNVAMFGIGLKLYVGEDIPKDEVEDAPTVKKPENKKITPKNDVESQIKDICRDLSANYENGKDECLKILKKYEPEKGLTKNMPKSVLPTVLKDIQQLKVDMEKA